MVVPGSWHASGPPGDRRAAVVGYELLLERRLRRRRRRRRRLRRRPLLLLELSLPAALARTAGEVLLKRMEHSFRVEG